MSVGAKHLGDNICKLTEIYNSECFALSYSKQGEAFRNRYLGVPDSSSPECFTPTELEWEVEHPHSTFLGETGQRFMGKALGR